MKSLPELDFWELPDYSNKEPAHELDYLALSATQKPPSKAAFANLERPAGQRRCLLPDAAGL
jgi:hypothetical protein